LAQTVGAGNVPPSGVRGPYLWLVVDLVIVAVLLALTAFNVAWQSIAGTAQKIGQSVGAPLIPILALLYGAKAGWQSLLRREPESNPAFKGKHRRFQCIAGTIIGVVIVFAVGLGVKAGNRIERNNRIEALLAQANQIGSVNTEFRERLEAIRSKTTPTTRDFYLQCLAVEGLLDQYEPNRQKALALFNSLVREVGDDPNVGPTIRIFGEISDKDSQVLTSMRTEVARAKQLIALPASQQMAFYEREISPIEVQIKKLADEEMALSRQAQERGLKLPSDVSDMLRKH